MPTIWDSLRDGAQGELMRPGPQITRSVPAFQPTGNHSLVMSPTTTAPPRGSQELLDTYVKSPALRQVVRLISSSVAAVPFYLVRKRDKRSQTRAWSSNVTGSILRSFRQTPVSDGQKTEIITEHPFLDWLQKGSPPMPGARGRRLTVASYLIKGESFWLLEFDGKRKNQPVMWMPLPATWIKETPTNDRQTYKVCLPGNGAIIHYPVEAIYWFKDPTLSNPYGRGAGLGDTLADELDTDEYAANVMRYTLANRGFADVLIQVNGAKRPSLERLQYEYNQKHSGFWNAGKAMIVEGDDLKVQPVTHSLSELKLIELREMEHKIVRHTFGVPPELIGHVENSNRATIDAARDIFAEYVMRPLLEEIRLDYQTRLLPMWDRRGEYLVEYVDPAPEAIEEKREIMQAAPPGSYTYNDWRQLSGHSPEPWGERRTLPVSSIEVPANAPIEQEEPIDEPG